MNIEKKLREKLFPGRPYVSSFVRVNETAEKEQAKAVKAMGQDDGGVVAPTRKKKEVEEKSTDLL